MASMVPPSDVSLGEISLSTFLPASRLREVSATTEPSAVRGVAIGLAVVAPFWLLVAFMVMRLL